MLRFVEAKGLFGRFDFTVRLKDEGITVLTGPNGFGKSTVFALISAAAAADAETFYAVPFEKFTIGLDKSMHVFTRSDDAVLLDGKVLPRGGESAAFNVLKNNIGVVRAVGGKSLWDDAIKDGARFKKYIEFIRSIPDQLKAAVTNGSIIPMRANMFTDLLREKLTFKTPIIDRDHGLSFLSSDGQLLMFSDLSAGEIQLTAFYYELLFNIPDGALILLDEPEISMHIVWQMTLVDDVAMVCRMLGGAQAIIATHSPQVLSGHRDKQVDLGEQYGR